MQLRDLPSVDELARRSDDPLAVEAARIVLARAREEIRAGGRPGDLAELLQEQIDSARAPHLRRVLNATGVIVHTNLGRAPLAEAALERVVEIGARLLEPRVRPRRRARAARARITSRRILRRLTGAEAALVVNNNAAAVLLALAALAEGREVLVSRGRADRDRRRLPDPRRARALGRAAASRSARPTARARPTTSAAIGAGHGAAPARAPVELPRRRLHRAAARSTSWRRSRGGTAAARRRPRLRRARRPVGDEPTARASLAAGADLVCFSGDKLLGGPQAGIVVGRADLVERLRRHPLQRALRADKLTLAALEGTLALYLDPSARARDPGAAHAARAAEAVRARAERLAELVGGEVEETVAPRRRRRAAARRAAELRLRGRGGARRRRCALGDPPVVGIVRDGRSLLDCRTLADDEVDEVARARSRAMPLTVGTAGHIDHGKTWLVRALTGKDTDRLPEEQERGISIDLGYAPLELPDGRRLSLVDVPGPRALRPHDGRRRDRASTSSCS